MVQRYDFFPKRPNKSSKKHDTRTCVQVSYMYPSRIAKAIGLVSLLFDTGFLTGEVAQVEDAGAAHSTVLVDINLLDERAGDGENTLHTDTVRNLADSKGFSRTTSAALQHNALEVLDTFFVTFFDFVMDSDGIASLEFGELLALGKGLDKLHYFILSHD